MFPDSGIHWLGDVLDLLMSSWTSLSCICPLALENIASLSMLPVSFCSDTIVSSIFHQAVSLSAPKHLQLTCDS